MSDFATKLLPMVKKTLRQADNEFDDEIGSYIDTVATDLQDAGIHYSFFSSTKPGWVLDGQILQACRWYALSVFGLYNPDMEKYAMAYASLKSTLATQKRYTTKGLYPTGYEEGYADAIAKLYGLTAISNGVYYPEDGNLGFNSVEVKVAPYQLEEKQIIFIDYDGTILHSYTPEEVLALEELPSHISKDPLLNFHSWNWTLEELKNEINLIGLDFMQHHKMAVGATYTTVDNSTYLFVDVPEQRQLKVYLTPKERTSVIVFDWGDGSDPTELTGTSSGTYKEHTYTKSGKYCIRISGDLFAFGSSYYSFDGSQNATAQLYKPSILEKAYIGPVNRLSGSTFRDCWNLKSVVFSHGLNFLGSTYSFQNCYCMDALILPKSSYSVFPDYAIPNAGLEKLSLPFAEFKFNQYTAQNARKLRYFHIPSISTIFTQTNGKQINNAFSTIIGLESVTFFEGITGESTFVYCSNLKQALIKGIDKIPRGTFSSCNTLVKFKVYDNISLISSYAFENCYSLLELDLTSCDSVVTLESTNAFSSVSTAFKILVKKSLEEEWKAATNWSTFANRIVGVEV